MLGLGLVSLVILTMAAMITSTLRSNQKGISSVPAAQSAESLLDEQLYLMDNDLPPGARAQFWSASGTWKDSSSNGALLRGDQSYDYTIRVSTVNDTSGVAAGSVSNEPGNRLKKVDLTLWWWGTRPTGQRVGMGRLEYRSSRIVNEQDP